MTVLEVAMVDETILLLFNADRIFNHPDPDVGLQTFSALCNELQIQLQLRRRRRLSACCGDLILRKLLRRRRVSLNDTPDCQTRLRLADRSSHSIQYYILI